MKFHALFVIVLAAALLLSACAPVLTPSPQAPSSGSDVSTPVNTPVPDQPKPAKTLVDKTTPMPEAIKKITGAALQQLTQSGVIANPVDKVEMVSFEQVDWPDSCLGAGGPAESCMMVITPGYKVMMRVDGIPFEIHANMDGSEVRIANSAEAQPTEDSSGRSYPAGVLAAVQALAQQQGIDPSQIHIVTFEDVQWPDGCLGVVVPGRMCTMMVTPGYKVILEVNQQQFEYHTDLDGQAAILANNPFPKTANNVLTWEQTANGTCWRAEFGPESVSFGPCAGPLSETPYVSAVRAKQLQELAGLYQSFNTGTPAGTVSLNGTGTVNATEVDQRSVAEWARLAFQEQQAGRSGAAWGVVITWHREGGIAGFCDDLSISLDGFALAGSCKGNRPTEQPAKRLTTDELKKLYEYADAYASFEYMQKDNAVADAMSVRVVFTSGGQQTPSDEQQQEVARFAADVYARK